MKNRVTLVHAALFWGALTMLAGAAAVGTIADSELLSSVRTKLNTLIGRVNELSVTDGLLGFSTQGAIEIASGVATISTTVNVITAETTPGADTVDTVTLSGAVEGDIAIFYTGDASDVITFADGTAGADNLDLGADVVLDSVNETLILRYNGTNWVQLANSANIETVDDTETWIIAASDETTDLTATGNPKVTFRAPYACTITGVKASVTTAPVGATLIVDINDGGTSIMTTNKLDILTTATIDDGTATLTDTALAEDAVVTIDIDQIGSSTAGAGLKVYIEHTRD